jgi:Fe-S-cluster containining protein
MVTELPVLSPDRAALVPCLQCAQCCTYVAIEVEEPNTLRNATDILWFLYHERVSILMERKDRWTLQFDTRCRNLTDDLLCKIYPFRPHICREYDSQACEVNARGNVTVFRTPGDFLEYMKTARPRTYRSMERRFIEAGNGTLPPASRPRKASVKSKTRKKRPARRSRRAGR